MNTWIAVLATIAVAKLGAAAAIAPSLQPSRDGSGPVWMLASPWVDPAAIVAAAGAYIPIRPAPAFGTVVHDQGPGLADRLRAHGALVVLDAAALGRMGCDV
ncbi:hypothetical protein [Jannaschia sp. LMIT008]|uniref:hypothetical protein n=1 Tax=Jannaschia maritima TaxID=3032585 RepID=UPI002811C7AE|nr:hypothetical protein [Jannaschia sp. LMIT008]